MNGFAAIFRTELLKARRSKVPLLTWLGFSIAPLVAGLFMLINKDPERARELGLLGQKAQLMGTADWPTYFGLLSQMIAMGGLVLFAIITAWVFGREFADRTVRTLLAMPVRRRTVVLAKSLLVAAWCSALALWVLAVGLGIGALVVLPGWSAALAGRATAVFAVVTLAAIALQSTTALVASAGRGYLPPLGWAVFTLVVAQVAAVLGWGDWFPWAVPALYSGVAGPAVTVGAAAWALLSVTALAGLALTVRWWSHADQGE